MKEEIYNNYLYRIAKKEQEKHIIWLKWRAIDMIRDQPFYGNYIPAMNDKVIIHRPRMAI